MIESGLVDVSLSYSFFLLFPFFLQRLLSVFLLFLLAAFHRAFCWLSLLSVVNKRVWWVKTEFDECIKVSMYYLPSSNPRLARFTSFRFYADTSSRKINTALFTCWRKQQLLWNTVLQIDDVTLRESFWLPRYQRRRRYFDYLIVTVADFLGRGSRVHPFVYPSTSIKGRHFRARRLSLSISEIPS